MDDQADRNAEALQLRNLRRIHAGLAHDLRSPFNAAFLQLELFKLTADRGARPQVERLEHLESELQRLRGAVEALVAQFEADASRRAFDLSTIVREIGDLTASQADKEGVEVVVRTGSPLRVSARADLVRSSIFGLVLRALDTLARSPTEGGKLCLETREDDGDALLAVSVTLHSEEAPEEAGSQESGSPPDVVREILESHGASLRWAVEDDELVWRLRMPLAPTD